MGASEISISAPEGRVTGAPITFSALITRAESPYSGNASPMRVVIHDPDGEKAWVNCAEHVTVAAEETYTCEATREFSTPGTYTYYFAWQGASGDQPWYRMSETRTFALDSGP